MKRWIQEFYQTVRTTVFANPVVVRDLRAQMRGTKSYWYQGAYLLLLGILAIAGYANATGQGLTSNIERHVNIVDAQSQLSTLYNFIFGTIAAFILLIAPALTASSIVGERQRLSFDLLVTTPLRASELLIGKLVSSIAFLGLLLCLSLPAAALCILLGGATLGDVFRVYVQLAIDGAVLAAIGLFFSCASKTNLLAVMWSYVSVGAFVGITMLIGASMSGVAFAGGDLHASPLLSIVTLNPVAAIDPAQQHSVYLLGLHLPTLLVSAVFAILAIRLLVTAATFRLGVFGIESAISLRRQLLPLVGLFIFLFSATVHGIDVRDSNIANTLGMSVFMVIFCGFVLALCFLPSLFVPTTSTEDMPGGLHRHTAADGAIYRMRRAMLPVHSGAMPYFHLLMLVITVSTLLALPFANYNNNYGLNHLHLAGYAFIAIYAAASFGYTAAIGFLMWSISRLAATMVRSVAGARGLSFGIFALMTAAPMMILALSGSTRWDGNPVSFASIFYPIIASGNSGQVHLRHFLGWIAVGSADSVILGVLVLGLRAAILRRVAKRGVASLPSGAAPAV